jgi:hypothetical protein
MHPVDAQKRDEIVELARRYLAKYQPTDYRLEIEKESVMQDEDWYYVVVVPSRDDVRSYDYSARLAEAELDLQEKEPINVLLVPALPD